MKFLQKIEQYLLGSLFVFSGFVKLIDPKGTQYKLEEYFTSFAKIGEYYIGSWSASFFNFFIPYALIVSITLCVFEVVLGFCLLINHRKKVMLWISFFLLIFFTFLTAYSAQCSPNNAMGVSCVTDCGCFGDFLKLKPIESFYKNLVLLFLTIHLLFLSAKNIDSIEKKKDLWLIIAVFVTISFGIYNSVCEPIIDFRPYKIGANLIENRKNGKPAERVYIMSKDGKEEIFTEYPNSKTYTFMRTEIVKEEVLASIHDFYLFDSTGEDVTEKLLLQKSNFIIFKSANLLSKDDLENIKALNKLEANCIILSNDNPLYIIKKIGVKIPIFILDETIIKTIVRNYPHVMQVEKGIVTEKTLLSKYLKQKENQ